jgi:hypothetical protein
MAAEGHRPAGAPAMLAALSTHPALSAVTAGYTAGFGVYALDTGNARYLVYGPVMVALAGAVAAIHARVRLTTWVLWALSLWGLAHMAGGMLPSPVRAGEILYDVNLVPGLLRYDKAVHACGMAAATVACWQALRAAVRPAGAYLAGACVVAWLASMGLGAVNEMVEFLAARVTSNLHVGDFDNTGWDLVANLVGSAVAAAWLYLRADGDLTCRHPLRPARRR